MAWPGGRKDLELDLVGSPPVETTTHLPILEQEYSVRQDCNVVHNLLTDSYRYVFLRKSLREISNDRKYGLNLRQ